MLAERTKRKRLLLLGLESVGKTTLFSRWTQFGIGEETNVKGTTYTFRSHPIRQLREWDIVDTPGLRRGDELGKRQLEKEVVKADHVMLIIRGTHFHEELQELLSIVPVTQSNISIAVTFVDKINQQTKTLLENVQKQYNLPLFLTKGRKETAQSVPSFEKDGKWTRDTIKVLQTLNLPKKDPASFLFDRPIIGPLLSVLAILLMFLLPVYVAYKFSDWGQPYLDVGLASVVQFFEGKGKLIEGLLVGDYGLLTLGAYSFLWAFPVVLFLSIMMAITDETGIKDRITDALDPYLRKIGLNGQDLIPVLSGFGCNVVAVQQSRLCSACTRKACVSLVSFGSACSYQIGATISIFHSAQKPHLFLPYLLTLFIVGALHTKIWNRQAMIHAAMLRPHRTFIQMPTWSGVSYRVRSTVFQFLTQAMPIFLIICFIAGLLDVLGWIDKVVLLFAPVVQWMNLPAEAAIGLVFSIIRKDGILLFNEGNLALLTSMSPFQLFLLVYLASTFSACAVTIWTIAKEFNVKEAILLSGKQMITSLTSTLLLLLLFTR
ncbi:MAG: 50S ribosome-binding GTPase [Bacillus sp. (in: Bacteria)]|nr:50S ribosome-binding GTPase [Bacillus sp. (in: firmicutes)]